MSHFSPRDWSHKPSQTRSNQSLGEGTLISSRSVLPDSAAVYSDTDGTITGGKSRPKSFGRIRFGSSWAKKQRDKNNEDGARGPLGLQLLHSSPEPLIDLIFVHGLRGGSVKTWRKGGDHRLFWPQFWLPMEPGLRNVNIHTFGYDADWASTKSSVLNIHDFGQSLLEELRNSPYLRNNGNGPVILLGHSMGGLVIKKAFILAKDTPDFQDRIRCMFFLATPHRGSDYAAILNNILTISGIMSSRLYINDLLTGSTSTRLINEDFGKCANDIPIYSFCETLNMSIGISSILIVEKDSAILGAGFRNERSQYLAANHRDICKFESPDDPNYVTLRNALTSAIQDLVNDVSLKQREKAKEDMKLLKSYLGISDRPDEHYDSVEGSCQWIDARDDFQDWRDSAGRFPVDDMKGSETDNKRSSLYWVHANPGVGKTYLAAHVISELQDFQLECAYYYFHAGDKTSRSLGDFLRSMAYQMAMSNAAIRSKLVGLYQDGSTFDMDDAQTIWTKVFRRGIFQSRVYTVQYWVIDAIDECSKYQEFFTMLRGDMPDFPLRIFITSRKVTDTQRLCRPLEATATLTSIEIPERNSMSDIECYISNRIETFSIDNVDKQQFGNDVLRRSNASFLWVRLVLDELEQVYSEESAIQILRGIPEGMVPYYERTIRVMAENKLEKHIAKAVLMWVVSSSRKITTSELSQALKLDINTILRSAKSAVEGLCGQLVTVDNADLIDVIHPTAREFLLSEAAGEFSVSEQNAHERIAMTCLQLLCTSELQPPRTRRASAPVQTQQKASHFLDYALTQFSEHIYSASAEKDSLLIMIDRFFRTNVLTWIERIAQKGDLHCLIRTSKNLKAYLDRRAKYRSPLSSQVKNVAGWSMDLSRLVTKFGGALLHNPSAIYFLIPPLCPSDSAVYQQFGKRPDGLAVVGFKNKSWDDCIASVSFGDDIAAAVSCGENLIAVGMESGEINLYNHRSCQKEKVLHHRNPVDLVHFADSRIATCTTRFLVLQDLDGNTIWQTRLRFRCILLTSSGNSLVAVSQHGHVLRWDMSTGILQDDQSFVYRGFDSDVEQSELISKAPSLASISPDMEILALGYRGGAVCLWELQTGDLIGWARDDEDRLPAKLLFNPNPNINLLLVIYSGHQLSLYETWSGSLVHVWKGLNDIGLLSASCSPEGRTLATTDMQGNMQIWDFESLTPLYHVLSPFPSFRILNFTSDGSNIVDVMDSGMRIWSPAVLVRKNVEEDTSVSDDAPQPAAIEGQYESLRKSRITKLFAHPSLPVVFAGRYNGDVVSFSTKTGEQMSLPYSHSSAAFVTELVVSQNNIIASSDVTGGLQVWRLSSVSGPESGVPILRAHLTTQVKQLCFSVSGDYLLISTTSSDEVYSMTDGCCIGSLQFDSRERTIWRWLSTSDLYHKEEFILLCDHVVRRYSVSDFLAIDSPEVHLEYKLPKGNSEVNIDTALVHKETQILVLEIHHDSNYISSSTTFFFDLSNIPLTFRESGPPLLSPVLELSPDRCKHFVGTNDRTKSFIFLDGSGWLCSVEFSSLTQEHCNHHFFVPNEYVSSNSGVLPVKTADNEIVFCLHGEVTIVKNGLRFQNVRAGK